MKKGLVVKKLILPLALASCTTGVMAQGSDLTLRGSFSTQQKSLEFNQSYIALTNVAVDETNFLAGETVNFANLKATLPMFNIGLAGAYGKVFFAFKFETSMASTSDSTSETDQSVEEGFVPNLITISNSRVDVERTDLSFTLGMNVWKSLSIFAGYLDGVTTLSPHPFCANNVNQSEAGNETKLDCSRSNRAFQQFTVGDLDPDVGYIEYEQKYEESGFYIGGSYAWPVYEVGSVAINAAYAVMDAEYDDNAFDPNGIWGGVYKSFKYEGESKGTSIGVTWSGNLSDRYEYFVDVRRQSYSMEATDALSNSALLGLDTEETMMGYSIGIRAYFF